MLSEDAEMQFVTSALLIKNVFVERDCREKTTYEVIDTNRVTKTISFKERGNHTVG